MEKAIEILLQTKEDLETNIEYVKKRIKTKEYDLSELYKNLVEEQNKHSSIVELLEAIGDLN